MPTKAKLRDIVSSTLFMICVALVLATLLIDIGFIVSTLFVGMIYTGLF